MPNQVRILAGYNTDISLFVTNPALIRVLSTDFDEVSDFEYQNSTPKPSPKKQAILIACRANISLMDHFGKHKKCTALSPKARTVKTKYHVCSSGRI